MVCMSTCTSCSCSREMLMNLQHYYYLCTIFFVCSYTYSLCCMTSPACSVPVCISVLLIFMAFLTACIPCIEVFQEAIFLMCNNVRYSCGTPCICNVPLRVISIHEVIFSLMFQFSLSMTYSSSFLMIGICVHFQLLMLIFCSTVRGGKEGEFN